MKMKIGNGRETAVFQYLCELAMKDIEKAECMNENIVKDKINNISNGNKI